MGPKPGPVRVPSGGFTGVVPGPTSNLRAKYASHLALDATYRNAEAATKKAKQDQVEVRRELHQRTNDLPAEAKKDASKKADEGEHGKTDQADVEAPLVEAAARKPASVDASTQLEAKQGTVTHESLGNGKGPEQTRFKGQAVNNFLSVAIAAGGIGVGLYFLVTSIIRKQCIENLLAKYPEFQSEKKLTEMLTKVGDTCTGVTDTKTTVQVGENEIACAKINDAYNMLDRCDNTLMRNVVKEMMKVPESMLNAAQNTAESLIGKFGEFVSKWKWIVLAVIGGIVVLIVVATRFYPQALPAFMRGRKRGARATARAKTKFGTRRPCSLRR
jgi:hypothetical protein